jgi:hypothetical protein
MLAAQTSDGDLRVWSVPKQPHTGDSPCVIRILNKSDQREPGPCWFAWSKNGRIVQYTEGYVLFVVPQSHVSGLGSLPLNHAC